MSEKKINKKTMKEMEKIKKMKSVVKKPKVLDEFKEFVMKGNVLDMAVGVIIGGAFGKIVTSLVNDILMPAISLITGQIDVASLKYERVISDTMSINLNYGVFLQSIIDFLIISLSIFAVIKVVNKLSRKKEEEKVEESPKPSKEEVLLTEIRDVLKAK